MEKLLPFHSMNIMKKKLTTVIIIFIFNGCSFFVLAKNTAMIITGEPSGEELACWYVRKTSLAQTHTITALASKKTLEVISASSLEGFDDLKQVNILRGVGTLFWALISKHLLYRKLVKKIFLDAPDLLVLVDFPWINLRLACALKKMLPATKIVYIAPPELWFWGRWGIDSYLRNYCDERIVLYPQEQLWYSKKNLEVRWLGYPYEDEFYRYLSRNICPIGELALLPGSREAEVKKSLPLMCQALLCSKARDSLNVLIVKSHAIPEKIITDIVSAYGLERKVIILNQNDRERLSFCFYALTKPGTVTLHLALLGVPHAVIFKGSWLTSLILKNLIKPKALGLPNLLSEDPVCEEFLQEHACPRVLAEHIDAVFFAFQNKAESYKLRRNKVDSFRKAFVEYEKSESQAKSIYS